jgi:NADH-quinone oxidoreductase subunit H
MRNRISGGYHGILLYENGFIYLLNTQTCLSLLLFLLFYSSVAITPGMSWAVENWGVNLANVLGIVLFIKYAASFSFTCG